MALRIFRTANRQHQTPYNSIDGAGSTNVCCKGYFLGTTGSCILVISMVNVPVLLDVTFLESVPIAFVLECMVQGINFAYTSI